MLMKELDAFQGDDSKTSLKAYIEPFQKAFLNPLMKELRLNDIEAAEDQAAMIEDFSIYVVDSNYVLKLFNVHLFCDWNYITFRCHIPS
jgi:hypothetical protein